MAKQLLIVVGESGSGKTTIAKKYANERNDLYLDFDTLFNYKTRDNPPTFIGRLASVISSSPEECFILDGYWPEGLPTPAYLESALNVEVHWCLCFAAPHVIQRRQARKARDPLRSSPTARDVIQKTPEKLFFTIPTVDENALFIDTTNDTAEIVDKNLLAQRWGELLLLSDIDASGYDKGYQDIELPSGTALKGYSDSAKTWERLSAALDFKGAQVLDIGCFHGFFSFK